MVQLVMHNLFLIYEDGASGVLLSFYHFFSLSELCLLSIRFGKPALLVNEIET